MSSTQWTQLGLTEELSTALIQNGIIEPTEVQKQAIEQLLAGNDISAQSQTGSGKTLAFLLPMLQRINVQSKAIQGVVIAPTQELAMQIVRVAESYGLPLGIRIQQLIGGAAAKRQIEKLKQNPHIVIGTPGRMNELVKAKKLKLHQVNYLVIDEADQTFELGSSADIENLLFSINKVRQTAFFSATYPETMSRYEGRWMKEPKHIMLTPSQKVAASIEHLYILTDQRSKLDTTRRLLRTLQASSALLFINDTSQISNWESKLKYEGFKVEALYGESSKQARSNTLTAFREGKLEAILSTDVAARGIDITDLPLVIQIEPAIDADHYVHRAGRTGRMGKPGLVISIVTPQEKFIMDKFMKRLDIVIEERMLFRGKLLSEAQIAEATKYKPSTQESKRNDSIEAASNKRSDQGSSKQASDRAPAAPISKSNSSNISSNKGTGYTQKKSNTVSSLPPVTTHSAVSTKGGNGQKQAVAGGNEKRVHTDKKQAVPAKAKSKKKPNEGKNKGAPKWLKEKRQSTDQ